MLNLSNATNDVSIDAPDMLSYEYMAIQMEQVSLHEELVAEFDSLEAALQDLEELRRIEECAMLPSSTEALELLYAGQLDDFSTEGIKELASKSWEAVKKAIKAIWEKIKELYNRYLVTNKSLIVKLRALKDAINSADADSLKGYVFKARSAKQSTRDYSQKMGFGIGAMMHTIAQNGVGWETISIEDMNKTMEKMDRIQSVAGKYEVISISDKSKIIATLTEVISGIEQTSAVEKVIKGFLKTEPMGSADEEKVKVYSKFSAAVAKFARFGLKGLAADGAFLVANNAVPAKKETKQEDDK